MASYLGMKSEENRQKKYFEHSKLQMGFEDRKESCRRVVDYMYTAIKAISFQSWDEELEPIKKQMFEETRERLRKELLFIDEKGMQAIELFLDIMSETVSWDSETCYPGEKDKMIRRAYYELEFLFQNITDFLRSQVYLIKEEPMIISKISLLRACKFICDSRFKELNFSKNIIKLDMLQSPMDIINLANENLPLFKTELSDFIKLLRTNPLQYKRTEGYMDDITKIERLLIYI